jgi:hypothetical protein
VRFPICILDSESFSLGKNENGRYGKNRRLAFNDTFEIHEKSYKNGVIEDKMRQQDVVFQRKFRPEAETYWTTILQQLEEATQQ